LPPDAATVTCPTTIVDALHSTDATQTGRLTRIAPVSACGMTKAFPSTAADPSNPHFYRAYRFANTSGVSSCFNFTLTTGAPSSADASTGDASIDDASTPPDASGPPPPQTILAAYATFVPTDLSSGYLGDMGAVLLSPQTMAITVPAAGTIDVVVSAVDVAPAGAGPYTLSCSAQ
jgi:hypothetical protein